MSAACGHHHGHDGHGHGHGHGHGGHSHDHDASQPGARTALWIALSLNAGMFAIEIGAGLAAGSASLLADSADFLGDAANYGLSLAVLNLSLVWRARAALVKAASMGIFGLAVLGTVGLHIWRGTLPEPMTMGMIGVLALLANLASALVLYRFRGGDSNMRAVWLCTRNDAIGNVAVMLAAGAVYLLGNGWPDLLVATFMAVLAIWASLQVTAQAKRELQQSKLQSTQMSQPSHPATDATVAQHGHAD